MNRSATPMSDGLETPFRVDSIVQVPAPAGSEGPWQSYVIAQGTNTITGMRAGTRAEVCLSLDDMVERLNERCIGKLKFRKRT